MASDPSVVAGIPPSSPRKAPIGVRAAPTIQTSRMACSADKSCGLDIPRTPLVSRRWRWELHREAGALSGLGLDADGAAVLLDDAFHDPEAEAGARLALRREEG